MSDDGGILPGGYTSIGQEIPGEEVPYDESDDFGRYDDEDGDEPTGPVRARPGRRRPSRRFRQVRSVLLIALLIVVVFGGAGLLWAEHQINPGGRLGPKVTVTIPSGSSSATIGRILSRAGVIHDARLFGLYVKLEGAGPLLAGTYTVATNESYSRIIGVLDAGPPLQVDTLVIPEGFTLREIAVRAAGLPGMHFSAASFLALSSSGSVRSPYEPAAVNDLEGLVFPATYQVAKGQSAAQILTLLVQTFDERASALGLQQAAAALHMTPYQVVTVASIVQGEAKLDDQRPDVASVLYNRLSSGMTLGADSTLIYALRLTDPDLNVNQVNFEQPNPYNTRLNPGLPPTPIDNPGIPSLDAAAHPPKTPDLYFVEINPDGQLGFASTNAGFQQLTAECQAAKLC